MGNILSIPRGHLPSGNSLYADEMDVQETRRKRLRQLVDEYGTQTALADKLGIEQNYISRALSGRKRIMEDFAAKVEQATGKPTGWMSRLEKSGTDWPFEFDRRHWDGLPPEERRDLERNFMRMVLGAEAEQHMKRGKKRAS
jgi:transcriptional regulator with XRE-family HTH domain